MALELERHSSCSTKRSAAEEIPQKKARKSTEDNDVMGCRNKNVSRFQFLMIRLRKLTVYLGLPEVSRNQSEVTLASDSSSNSDDSSVTLEYTFSSNDGTRQGTPFSVVGTSLEST